MEAQWATSSRSLCKLLVVWQADLSLVWRGGHSQVGNASAYRFGVEDGLTFYAMIYWMQVWRRKGREGGREEVVVLQAVPSQVRPHTPRVGESFDVTPEGRRRTTSLRFGRGAIKEKRGSSLISLGLCERVNVYSLLRLLLYYYHTPLPNHSAQQTHFGLKRFLHLHFISSVWTRKYRRIVSSVNFSNPGRPPHLYILSRLVSYRPSAPLSPLHTACTATL